MSQMALTVHAYEAEWSVRSFKEYGWCKQGGTSVHPTARCLTTKSAAVSCTAVVKYLSFAEKAENNHLACSREFWAVHLSEQLCENFISTSESTRRLTENFSACGIIWPKLTAGRGGTSAGICSLYFSNAAWRVLIFWEAFFSFSLERGFALSSTENNEFDLKWGNSLEILSASFMVLRQQPGWEYCKCSVWRGLGKINKRFLLCF